MSAFSPLFTDLYQLTMAAGYWRSAQHEKKAVFELFFRKCPFDGEYAIFSGLDRVREILENFQFSEDEIRYLKEQNLFANYPKEFFELLKNFDLADLQVEALSEGSLCFPRVPLLRVTGPLWKAQLLESALLNAVNFSTLVATYARRIRLAAPEKKLVEFGMRRAQGPDGAMTASRASYLGGFDGSSNVEAGRSFNLPVYGTMAHSFVQSFTQESFESWQSKNASEASFFSSASDTQNKGELAAFIQYAEAFPKRCLLLIDTYDTLKSGLKNAIQVFQWMKAKGHEPLGVRLDSGDLVYLSKVARQELDAAGFSQAQVFASNDLSEDLVDSLLDQGAKIDAFGIGTHLVTCQSQPALGGVYKLVELDGRPRLKISQQTEKLVLPAAKQAYRLYGKEGQMILDYLALQDEPAPKEGQEIFAYHPTDPLRRARVLPSRVESLLQCIWKEGKYIASKNLGETRQQSLEAMKLLRDDIKRRHNPAAYKVSVSAALRETFQNLFEKESPPPRID